MMNTTFVFFLFLCYLRSLSMSWFNYYGLAIMVVIMLPNIVFAMCKKSKQSTHNENKLLSAFEQVGRFGCIVMMVFNIPFVTFNFWFAKALIVYLSINGALCISYIVIWFFTWNKNGKFKALSLSIIPSIIFLFSGIIIANIPLIAFSAFFAISHITISFKNSAQ